jgi:hypothetical protein
MRQDRLYSLFAWRSLFSRYACGQLEVTFWLRIVGKFAGETEMTYKVFLKQPPEGESSRSVTVTADDVNLDSCAGDDDDEAKCHCHYFNFIKGEDEITVAAFPFDAVLYITS